MTTETEELLWIAAQENKLFNLELIKFAIANKKTLADLLELEKSEFPGIEPTKLGKFLKDRESIPFNVYQRIFDHMQKDCIDIIPYRDPLFPKRLKNIEEKGIPALLYRQGKAMRYENGVAIVGTRNCSTHAVEFARETSQKLARLGYVIVSGLARGIDAAAHRGAISVGGLTVTVLPWMYEPYPPEHMQLLEEIKQHGSVISENFFKSNRLDKYKFLQRNAIISGISEVLVAVESSYAGGTRWPVELALSQGKKVITMEPERHNKQAYDGFLKFTSKGAIEARNPDEVVELITKEVELKDTTWDEFEYEQQVKLKPLLE